MRAQVLTFFVERHVRRIFLMVEFEVAVGEFLPVHDWAAVGAVRADGVDHLVVVVVAHRPDDLDLFAVEFIGHLQLKFPRIALERFLRPAEREGDAVRLFLDELEIRDAAEAVARQLVRLAVDVVLVVFELADNREQHRGAVAPPGRVAVPEVFRLIFALLDGAQLRAVVTHLHAELVVLDSVKHLSPSFLFSGKLSVSFSFALRSVHSC